MQRTFLLFVAVTPWLCGNGFGADVILNEYNAVDDENILEDGASDPFWGSRPGNGNDWFELVVITDHLDMRQWEFVVVNDQGDPVLEESFLIKLTADPIWEDVRSGTVVTISEDLRTNDDEYNPVVGNWWLNVRVAAGISGRYAVVSCISPMCAEGTANWRVSNNRWQVTIRDSVGTVVFGPAGEGIMPTSGVGGTEVCKLEEDPTALITPASTYVDGSSSTFGSPNRWMQGTAEQDFTALRSVVSYEPLTSVRINEVLTHSDPGVDWVEFFNTTGDDIDIGGWYLSDKFADLTQFQLPASTIVPANGYLVLDQTELGFGFSSACGDELILSQADGGGVMTGEREYAVFGIVETGVTFGRFPNGTGPFHRMATATPDASNSEPMFSSVSLTEIMYHPPDPGAPSGVEPEFVEIFNNSSEIVELFVDFGGAGAYGWRLSGGVDFEFGPGSSIAPYGYLVLVNFDPDIDSAMRDDFRTIYGIDETVQLVGPFSGRLSNLADTIRLSRPDNPETDPGSVCNVGDPVPFAPLIVTDEVMYFDFGDWPVTHCIGGIRDGLACDNDLACTGGICSGPDGGGASLERFDIFTPASLPTNWAANVNASATPGHRNSIAPAPDPVEPDSDPAKGNRYLRFSAPVSLAGEEAIRVRLISLDGFATPTPDILYVGAPHQAPEENSAQPGLTFTAAPLDCEPSYHDWNLEGMISVYGAEIMPGSVYEVQRANVSCSNLADNGCWSAPATATTAKWGDVAPAFDGPGIPAQPDFTDIAAMVEKFLGDPGAPIKAVAQLQPNRVFPENAVDFRDIAIVVNAFLGESYASQADGPCVCPPSVLCNVTPCVTSAGCVGGGGGMCVDGFCTDKCGRCLTVD